MTKLVAQKDEVLFSPLGGCNEIGRNLSLYGHDGAWIIVDCGIGFPPASLQGGIDAILPNPEFLYANAERIRGLIITHAHEDHLGAIAYLWGDKLPCPIFATNFAARLLQKKWQRFGNAMPLDIRTIAAGQRFTLAPFSITPLAVAHSVPEANALCIETPCGVLLHSGDWKLDGNPVIGEPSSEKLFDVASKIASKQSKPLLAMMSDSTNVFSDSASGDEASTQPAFEELFRREYKRIVVTLFASNVARIVSIARAARNCGRRLVIGGNALQRMSEIARACGYLGDLTDNFLDSRARIAADKLVLLATGSQGEEGSFMSRLAQANSPLTYGDVAVFSSRTIPGNEIPVGKVKNALVRKGVEIIDHNRMPSLHVSGHASGYEVERVYRRMQPAWLVPIHGEPRHLQENARIAQIAGLKTKIVTNGNILRFTSKMEKSLASGVVCETLAQTLPSEEQYLERSREKTAFLAQSDTSLRERSKLAQGGACSCFVTLDCKNAKGKVRGNAKVIDASFIVFGDGNLELLLAQRGKTILQEALNAFEEKRGKKELVWQNYQQESQQGSQELTQKTAPASITSEALQRAFKKELFRSSGRSPLVKMLIKLC